MLFNRPDFSLAYEQVPGEDGEKNSASEKQKNHASFELNASLPFRSGSPRACLRVKHG